MRRPSDPSLGDLDPQQVAGLMDLDPEAFRAALHAVADRMADYAARVEGYPVLPPVEPGSLAGLFPADPPEGPAPLATILDDYRALVEPNATHWSHPGFMALFATPASAAGVLGEMLMARSARTRCSGGRRRSGRSSNRSSSA